MATEFMGFPFMSLHNGFDGGNADRPMPQQHSFTTVSERATGRRRRVQSSALGSRSGNSTLV